MLTARDALHLQLRHIQETERHEQVYNDHPKFMVISLKMFCLAHNYITQESEQFFEKVSMWYFYGNINDKNS